MFKCIFCNEKHSILIQIWLTFVPNDPIDDKSSLIQVMAWHYSGTKPLSEPMMTHFTYTYMGHQGEMS